MLCLLNGFFRRTRARFFNSIDSSKRCLCIFALDAGFDIVQTGAGTKNVPVARFQCLDHWGATRIWHGLEDRIEKDVEGRITTKHHPEDTLVNQANRS